MELILMVRNLVALVRANDWVKAVALALEILTIITKGMDPNSPRPIFASAPESDDIGVMADSLESACASHGQEASGGLGVVLLPMLLKLLAKLLLG